MYLSFIKASSPIHHNISNTQKFELEETEIEEAGSFV